MSESIEAVEELEALPMGSVIVDATGNAWQKRGELKDVRGFTRHTWYAASEARGFYYSKNLVAGNHTPALLTWAPTK